jgi:hypothetical protein
MVLSRKFYVALKTADTPAYQLAAEAGIHPPSCPQPLTAG